MKKILISTMLLLGILFISYSVLADSKTGEYKVEFIQMQTEQKSGGISLLAQPSVSFEEFLYDALLNRRFDDIVEANGILYDAINVYNYRIPLEEALDIYENIALKNPELMLDTTTFGCAPKNGYAAAFVPFYLFEDKKTSDAEYAGMDKWISEFVSTVDKKLSDEEKLLKAYYFVADYVEYSTGEKYDPNNPLIYTAYNAYKNKHCVCQGYVTLMCEILERLDIKCGVVPTVPELDGTDAAHIWNYVVLGGKNYHLDITWDDFDLDGTKVIYSDFLVSDETRYANMGQRREYVSYASQNIPLWTYFDGDKVCDSIKYEYGYIWNFLSAATDIVSCRRGYRVNCNMPLDDYGNYDKASYVFAGVKIPDDNVIMSEITPNHRLFYIYNVKNDVDTRLFIALYDGQNRMTTLATTNIITIPEGYDWGFFRITVNYLHKANIMWLNSKTLAPLGRNVVME